MKLLVLLLAAASLAVTPAPVLAPGQGDAAAAVAAHNKGVLQGGHQNGTQDGGFTFELTGSGSILHSHDNQPGDKPFKSKATASGVVDCVLGTAQGCTAGTIESDAGGTVFLFWDSTTSWRVGTHANGTDATVLTGTVDGKGGFAFAGTDALSGTSLYLTGKAKLEKGQVDFIPTSLSGKITAVCSTQGHYGTGTFKGKLAAN
jgi:hypothetical protein